MKNSNKFIRILLLLILVSSLSEKSSALTVWTNSGYVDCDSTTNVNSWHSIEDPIYADPKLDEGWIVGIPRAEILENSESMLLFYDSSAVGTYGYAKKMGATQILLDINELRVGSIGRIRSPIYMYSYANFEFHMNYFFHQNRTLEIETYRYKNSAEIQIPQNYSIDLSSDNIRFLSLSVKWAREYDSSLPTIKMHNWFDVVSFDKDSLFPTYLVESYMYIQGSVLNRLVFAKDTPGAPWTFTFYYENSSNPINRYAVSGYRAIHRDYDYEEGFGPLKDYISPSDISYNYINYVSEEPDELENLNNWTYTSFGFGYSTYSEFEVGTYWEFELENLNTTFEADPWLYEYRFLAENVESKAYFFENETIGQSDLGNWETNWISETLSMNSLRDLVTNALNTIIIFIQFLTYLLVVAFNWLILAPFVYFVVFLNNIVLFYVIVAIVWVLYYLYQFLLNGLWIVLDLLLGAYFILIDVILFVWNWLMDNVFVPIWETLVSTWQSWFPNGFLYWLQNVLLPFILDLLIKGVSLVLAISILLISFGAIDPVEFYQLTYYTQYDIFNGVSNGINLIWADLLYIFGFLGIYLALIGMGALKVFFLEAKGYTKRANQLRTSLRVYYIPIAAILAFLKGLVDINKLKKKWGN